MNTKSIGFLVFTISTLLLIGCSALTGEEIARLDINEVSIDNNNLVIKEASLQLKKEEEISFWSDIDISYDGAVALRFKIEVLRDGINLGVLDIDPTDKNITLGEVKTSLQGKTNWSFTGKNTEYKIEEDGEYTFKGILVASNNPTLKIKKAEVILKK